jgi:hypothetical protein
LQIGFDAEAVGHGKNGKAKTLSLDSFM